MISFHIDYQGIETAIEQLVDLEYRLFDFRPLAVRIREIMLRQNREMRLLGLDQYGVPFVDLAPSTMEKRARQGRMGPPLAPDGGASPIVTAFEVDIFDAHPDDITIRGHWDSVPWVGFHIDSGRPRTRLPVRDPAGLPAPVQDEIAEAFEDHVASLLAQTY